MGIEVSVLSWVDWGVWAFRTIGGKRGTCWTGGGEFGRGSGILVCQVVISRFQVVEWDAEISSRW